MSTPRASRLLVTLTLALALFPPAAFAQGTRAPSQPLPPLQSAPQAHAPAQRSAPGAAAQVSGEDAAARRLERIEERLTDIQSHTAALESFMNSGGSIPAPASGDSSLSGDTGSRLGMLETQMQALSNQLADIMQRLQQLEGQSGAAPLAPGRQGAVRDRGSLSNTAGAEPSTGYGQQAYASRSPFSTASESPSSAPSDNASSGRYPAVSSATLPPVDGQDGGSQPTPPEARALYDQAYATLSKREYRAAEAYFSQFLQLYPSDPLAGSAQYYLGESAFVSGDYRQAADLFLKAYTTYPNSEKAPESLLKLGMALKRLGQGAAACDSFAELERKFPRAQTVIQRAQTERKRSNC